MLPGHFEDAFLVGIGASKPLQARILHIVVFWGTFECILLGICRL